MFERVKNCFAKKKKKNIYKKNMNNTNIFQILKRYITLNLWVGITRNTIFSI